MTNEQLTIIEKAAFYESGLSTRSCLEKIDSCTLEAIERYGRYLLSNQKEINEYESDAFSLSGEPTQLKQEITSFVERIINKVFLLESENTTLKQRLKDIKEGFEGCCYACEPVGILNQQLEAQLKATREDNTEGHNNAVELRMKLAETLAQNNELKKISKKLYGTVLHVYALAKENSLAIIGPELYKEAAEGAKEYEKYNG